MRQRSHSKALHEKVQLLKSNSYIAPHYLARMLKILPLPPEERTLDDISLLMEATKEFSFFWKFHENFESNIHEQCCQYLHVEYHDKGSIIIRQGEEGDKMYLLLSGEVDVFATKSELESKQFQQEQIDKENPPNLDPARSPTSSNKSRSPRRTQRMGTRRESLISNIPTEEDASPTADYGRKNTEEGDIEGSGADSRRNSIIFSRLRKLKPSTQNNTKNSTIRMVDIKELAYFANLDAFRGDNEFLWDGCHHLKFLNTIKSGSVFGEMALTTKRRRGATVIAMEDCILGVIHREDFTRIVQTFEKKVLDSNLDFFRQALKVNLSQEGMMKLSRMFLEEKATFRQTIFHEGNEAEGFYIVKTGEVLAYRAVRYPVEDPKKSINLQQRIENINNLNKGIIERPDAKNFGLKYPVKRIMAGQLLGDEVLLGHEKRIFTAECQSDTASLLYISYERFDRVFSKLKGMDQALLQKTTTDLEIIQERIENVREYIDQFLNVAKPSGPINQHLNYTHRLGSSKITPLHNILTSREGNFPAIERSHSPKNHFNQSNASSIFILSEVQTPKFSKKISFGPDKGFLRCHKQNEDALETSCDTIQHIINSNQKILDSQMKNYKPTEDPFLLKDYPFLNAKQIAYSYRKGRSLTPENRNRYLAALESAQKSASPFVTDLKEENGLLSSDRCRRLLSRVFKSSRKASPSPVGDKSREKSQRELQEKPLIRNLPIRSASTPNAALPKGSLLSIVTLKGRSQTPKSPKSARSTKSAYASVKSPSIATNEAEVTSFVKWSEKAYSSVLGTSSDKCNSILGAFSDRHSNPSLLMDESDRFTHVSFPVSDKTGEKTPKLKRPKSFEGSRAKSIRKGRIKRPVNLMVKGKPGPGMQVIEEEKPNTPNNIKVVQFPQKPERTTTPVKKFFEPTNEPVQEPTKFLKSTGHSMFRFRSIESSKRRRKQDLSKTESSKLDTRQDFSLKTDEIDADFRKTTRT